MNGGPGRNDSMDAKFIPFLRPRWPGTGNFGPKQEKMEKSMGFGLPEEKRGKRAKNWTMAPKPYF